MARSCIAAFVVVALAFPAMAQNAPGGRGAGGGFRGGMGMGPGMGGQTKVSLAANAQVQTELKLTQEQKDKIAELQRSARESMPGRGGNTKNLSQEERKKAFAENQEKRNKAVAENEKKLAEILKPEQAKRLDEITIQQRGARGLKDESTSKALKLTEDQIKKIDEALQWGQDETQKLMPAGGARGGRGQGMSAENREKMEKIQKDVEAKALAALTDAQKEQYAKMKGTPFKLERAARGAGRGGRGAGGGAGGGKSSTSI